MGRLPDYFAGRRITYREPYIMEGVLFLTTAQSGIQFPPGTFTHASDKPFEIHRMIPRAYGANVNEDLVDEADQRTLAFLLALVKMKITDLGKTMELQQSSTYLGSIVKGTAETTWEFAEPMYMAKGELLQIVLDSDTFPAGFAADEITRIRTHIVFEGFQVIVGPASDNR